MHFLRNKAVTVEEMVAEVGQRGAQRGAGRHVLAIQDTTVMRSEGRGARIFMPYWRWMPRTTRSWA